ALRLDAVHGFRRPAPEARPLTMRSADRPVTFPRLLRSPPPTTASAMSRIHRIPSLPALLILALGALPLAASAATVTVRPSKDNVIYGPGDADLANGHGGFLFAGSSGPTGGSRVLRSLIAFDL